MNGVTITIEPHRELGLVFWSWSIAKLGVDGKAHVEVTGLSSNSYLGACDAVERELNQHYRSLETS